MCWNSFLSTVLMNDLVFYPDSVVDPDFHNSFSKPRNLGCEACINCAIITAGQCKDKVADDMKVKLYKSQTNMN